MQAIGAHHLEMSSFKSTQMMHAAAKGLFSLGSAVVTITPVGLGIKLGFALASQLGANTDIDLFGNKFMKSQVDAYRRIYDEAQVLNDKLKEDFALACGEK